MAFGGRLPQTACGWRKGCSGAWPTRCPAGAGPTWRAWPSGPIPRSIEVAYARDTGAFLGFTAYDVARAGALGPMGVIPEARTGGAGSVLLKRCLRDLRGAGYEPGGGPRRELHPLARQGSGGADGARLLPVRQVTLSPAGGLGFTFRAHGSATHDNAK